MLVVEGALVGHGDAAHGGPVESVPPDGVHGESPPGSEAVGGSCCGCGCGCLGLISSLFSFWFVLFLCDLQQHACVGALGNNRCVLDLAISLRFFSLGFCDGLSTR